MVNFQCFLSVSKQNLFEKCIFKTDVQDRQNFVSQVGCSSWFHPMPEILHIMHSFILNNYFIFTRHTFCQTSFRQNVVYLQGINFKSVEIWLKSGITGSVLWKFSLKVKQFGGGGGKFNLISERRMVSIIIKKNFSCS